jgi:ribosomal protein S18 acetylase RimI-like enzyme
VAASKVQIMITPTLSSRAELLELTGRHPFVALTSRDELTAYHRNGSWVWMSPGPWGPQTMSLGEPAEILPLLADLHRQGSVAGRRLHVPRTSRELVAAHFEASDFADWDLLWSVTAPPAMRGEDTVEELPADTAPEIGKLLDMSLPDSGARPGDQDVRAWYGIRDEGRLVAVAADRSPAGMVAHIAGIAVAPDRQGRGLGAAITGALTRRLFAEYPTVSLAVMSDNDRAVAVYERLGYRERLARTSFNVL